MIAVGEHYIKPLPDLLIRTSCPFGGGVGGCREEVCGVLSGATLILGALWGRPDSGQSDDRLKELVCEYRQAFLNKYAATKCSTIRDRMAGRREPGATKVCVPVVVEGSQLLVDLIESAHQDLAFSLP